MKHYSKSDIDFIRNNLDTGNKELGEILGRSADSIKERMLASGLKRSKKQVSDLRKKPNSGQYKKGSLPHNYNGGEFLSKDGYVVLSVGKCKQRLKHVHLWEQKNGPLPKGFCLRCVDGNILNTEPSNWKLISRSENMLMNSIRRYPEELTSSILKVAKIKKLLKTKYNEQIDTKRPSR